MERWQHDAFLGYMAECEANKVYSDIVRAMTGDIVAGFSKDYIVDTYARKIGYDAAEEIYDELIEQFN